MLCVAVGRVPSKRWTPLHYLRRLFTAKGYQSIGSFHSDNLADLISQPESDYVPPELPFEEEPVTGSDFLLDLDRFTFLNHGAFGGALRVAVSRAEHWRRYLETQPLRYFDRDLLPHLVYSTRELAKLVHASPETVVLIHNVTSGMNSCIGGFVREFGDAAHVIFWDTTYGSVKKMARHYCGDANVTEIPLQAQYLKELALNPQRAMQEALDDTMDSLNLGDKCPLFIIDHTSSNTALTFPVQQLASQAKQWCPGSLVLIDGAHGLLAQDVRLSQMPDVDMYVTNGHKWFGCPRGVGLLYAKLEMHDTVLRHPAIISHGVDEPDLFSRFIWDGCRDYAAALSVPAALKYWDEKNPEKVRMTLRKNLRQGIQVLVDSWHQQFSNHIDWPCHVTLTDYDRFPVLSPMALVRLPRDPFGNGATSSDAKYVQDFLYHKGIEVPIKCIQGELFVRLSCHIYNQTRDFQSLALAFRQFDVVFPLPTG